MLRRIVCKVHDPGPGQKNQRSSLTPTKPVPNPVAREKLQASGHKVMSLDFRQQVV
jgi:hypothetical protein